LGGVWFLGPLVVWAFVERRKMVKCLRWEVLI
jgi:hypothetical protein